MGDESIFIANGGQMQRLLSDTLLDVAVAEIQLEYAKQGRGLFSNNTMRELRQSLEAAAFSYLPSQYRPKKPAAAYADSPFAGDPRALERMNSADQLLADEDKRALAEVLMGIKLRSWSIAWQLLR